MKTLSAHYREVFGCKVYKLSLDGGFSCPNRDGTLGTGGCIFCTGSGEFAEGGPEPIPVQLERAKSRAFSFQRGKGVQGLYQSATERVLPIEDCLLEDASAGKIASTALKLASLLGIQIYDLETGRGNLRTLLLRRSLPGREVHSGEVMAVIVTKSDKFPQKKDFAEKLLAAHPEITTLVWNVNPTETAVFLGQKSEILFGKGYITDYLCGLEFCISPASFYQVNPLQTEILYGKVKEFAALTGKERVIDAYCGTGTIGLTLADSAREVIGVESNPQAVEDALANAARNHIENAWFVCRDAGQFLEEAAKHREKVDVVITDPPRAGCSKQFLQSLLTLAPKRVVYVSCNPETLARDLFVLSKGGYRVKKIQPVDMFPHTNHVECVVEMVRR